MLVYVCLSGRRGETVARAIVPHSICNNVGIRKQRHMYRDGGGLSQFRGGEIRVGREKCVQDISLEWFSLQSF